MKCETDIFANLAILLSAINYFLQADVFSHKYVAPIFIQNFLQFLVIQSQRVQKICTATTPRLEEHIRNNEYQSNK